MNDVEQHVSDLRELRPTMGFDREIISEEKWRQQVEEYGVWTERTLSDDDIRVLSAFDMLDADVGPYDLRVDLEQRLGGIIRGGYRERDHVCLTWRSAETTVVLGSDKGLVELLVSTLDMQDSAGSGG